MSQKCGARWKDDRFQTIPIDRDRVGRVLHTCAELLGLPLTPGPISNPPIRSAPVLPPPPLLPNSPLISVACAEATSEAAWRRNGPHDGPHLHHGLSPDPPTTSQARKTPGPLRHLRAVEAGPGLQLAWAGPGAVETEAHARAHPPAHRPKPLAHPSSESRLTSPCFNRGSFLCWCRFWCPG